MNTSEQALDHRCPSCGGKLLFTPSNGKWTCEYCASVFDLETLQKFDNASNAKSNAQTNTVDDTSYVEYRCQNCGASIVADDQTASTFCVYCGNTAILKSKLSGKFAPSKIIPFSKTKEEAITAFKSLSKGRPLMPKFFNQKENIEKISGVYIPFWLYTMMINAKADGTGERVSTWTTGK